MEIIIAFLIGLALGGTGGGLAGVWIAYNLQPRNEIQYITQNTTQNTTQKTEVFQGQVTVVAASDKCLTNIHINIAGITNVTLFSNATTNYILSNQKPGGSRLSNI